MICWCSHAKVRERKRLINDVLKLSENLFSSNETSESNNGIAKKKNYVNKLKKESWMILTLRKGLK